jgi:hypothetical protein
MEDWYKTSIRDAQQVFDEYVLSQLQRDRPLSRSDFPTCTGQLPRTVLQNTLCPTFPPSWNGLLWAERDRILQLSEDPQLALLLPIECPHKKEDPRFVRRKVRLCDWPGAKCGCTTAELSIRDRFPQLVHRLANPADAERPATLWTHWACSGDPRHRTRKKPAVEVSDGQIACADCTEADEVRAKYAPGTQRPDPGKSRRPEKETADALRLLLPGEAILIDTAIVTADLPEHPYWPELTPDILLPERKVAIEIDGGTGDSPRESKHDTEDGVRDDITRDWNLAALGWATIRVRYDGALALEGSPAELIYLRHREPWRVVANRIVSKLTELGWDSPRLTRM